jgi:hypothetical protein
MYTEHSYAVKNPQNIEILKINNEKYKKNEKIMKFIQVFDEKRIGAHIHG